MDWDEDGDFDIISGESDGYVTLFRNVGSPKNPVLTDEGHIKSFSTDIDVGSLSTPDVLDWNADGKKDLVIGSDVGYIYVYLNTGTNKVPAFGTSSRVMDEGGYLQEMKNYPKIEDLNRDGLFDIVMGWYQGSCLYWPNYGEAGAPEFDDQYELTGFTDLVDPDPVNPNWSHCEVADWNEDGNFDLLYTRWESEVYIHLNAAGLLQTTAEPVGGPVVIPSGGGSFKSELSVSNLTGETAIVDGWVEVEMPGGSLYGPVVTSEDLSFAPYQTRNVLLSHNVPSAAPAGEYTYFLYIGNMGNGYFESDSFNFVKE